MLRDCRPDASRPGLILFTLNRGNVPAVRPIPTDEGDTVESWHLVWREGFLPSFTTDELLQILQALKTDDPRLSQGSTTTPPPLMCVQDWPVECGCLFAYVGAIRHGGFDRNRDDTKNDNPASVGQCEEEFARLCFDADQRLGEPAACRWFLNWFDGEPRDRMRAELAAEIETNLRQRATATA